ncbi:hypothetical protein ACFXO9_31405 [Nocardia tengchongensis]|uniref:hypothetical protein n=1 Tax=Nocardia tengchongensis TaxID=2055889 RepID=UPI0036BD0F3D
MIVKNLVPNAEVELTVNGTVVRGQTPPEATTVNMLVDTLQPGMASVRQRLCNTWSAVETTPIESPPAQIAVFTIIEPLNSCSTIVSLAGVHEGATVHISSARFGPIGAAACNTSTDPFVVTVAPALYPGDTIAVTQEACGGDPTTVTANVQSAETTPPPHIDNPIFIGSSTINLESLVLGATVLVTIEDKSGTVLQVITVAAASDFTLPVTAARPLDYGDVITARQSLCNRLSRENKVTVELMPMTADWWTWDAPLPVYEWNREYTVAGTFTNKGTTPISNLHLTYWENADSQGDLSPGLVAPGAETKGAYPQLKQNWSWLTPGIWNFHGPFSKNFFYHIDITGTDATNTSYPVVSTKPFLVIVEVSNAKRLAAATAASQAVAAIALGAASAAAAAGIVTLPAATALGVLAGIAAGVSATAGAVALDPPEPTPDFQTRVPMPVPVKTDAGTHLSAVGALLDTLTEIFAIELAKSTMQSRRLGAARANAKEWIAVHTQDLATATTRQRALADASPGLLASATTQLAPVARDLESAYTNIRHNMLTSGFPTAVATSANLRADQLAMLDVLARSPEVGYPTADLIASLQEATTSAVSFVDAASENRY